MTRPNPRKAWLGIGLACLTFTVAKAAQNDSPPAAPDTPAANSGPGDRTLRHEVILDAPVDEVWKVFTTKEGVESWMVPLAEVDFRLGGTLKTNYNAKGTIGDEGTITQHVLAFEPLRMITWQSSPPANAPNFIKVACQGWAVIRFDELSPRRTRVTVTGCGYGTGPDWDKALEFFERGNAWTLQQLQKRFADAEADRRTKRVLELYAACAGGDFVHEAVGPDGGAFRSRARYEVVDGTTVSVDSWLGNQDGMAFHGRTILYRDPETREARFMNFGERGAIARGSMHLADDNRVVYDWQMIGADGGRKLFHVEVTFEGPDAYVFRLWDSPKSAADGAKPGVEARHSRVAKLPEAFEKTK
jgi:uncharacterized protein YndB with AHSA1/START domain